MLALRRPRRAGRERSISSRSRTAASSARSSSTTRSFRASASRRPARPRAPRSARALDHAAAIASAELYGVMSRALEMSVDYMKTRVQFGKPIGSFQALQHRAVDLYIQQQLASATLEDGLRDLDRDPARARARGDREPDESALLGRGRAHHARGDPDPRRDRLHRRIRRGAVSEARARARRVARQRQRSTAGATPRSRSMKGD